MINFELWTKIDFVISIKFKDEGMGIFHQHMKALSFYVICLMSWQFLKKWTSFL